MQPIRSFLLAFLPPPMLGLCIAGGVAQAAEATSQQRQPAVAGQFYPGTSAELRGMLDELFRLAEKKPSRTTPLVLIVPHAGYVFSGEVAASAYAQIEPGQRVPTVFVIGPSHRVGFEGAAVYVSGDFVTPLGSVTVDRAIGRELIQREQLFSDRTDAHAGEHSIEVQLPFLQRTFPQGFRLVPIVLGAQRPEGCQKIAAALAQYVRPGNLFVISTDFSHYPSYDDATRADRAVAEAVLSRSPRSFMETVARVEEERIPGLETAMCGWNCTLTMMYMTEHRDDIKFEIVKYRNSGDAGYRDKRRVVGYYAIAGRHVNPQSKTFMLAPADRSRLLSITRDAVEGYVRDGKLPPLDNSTLPAALKTPCGAFVTLHARGELRGCIGRFDASEPLYLVARQMAVAASSKDPRFLPVRAEELGGITIEISVLTPMRRISSIGEFDPGKHGIYIQKGSHSGTFLPQVAKETGWSREELLGHCSQDKAGIGWDGWRDAELYVYEALVFGEHDKDPQ